MDPLNPQASDTAPLRQDDTDDARPWRADDFDGQQREPDARPPCPRCGGTGLVREWSWILFMVAAIGFSGAILAAIKAALTPEARRMLGTMAFFATCFGVLGAFPLIDKGDCKTCSGMGRLEDEKTDDEDDDFDAEWAQSPPPE